MNKLAIVGSAQSTRALVPWDDKSYDIWTINEAATMKDSWVKRCNGIFQLHPRNIWDNKNNKNDPNHGEWLKNNTTARVFMMEKYPDVPMAEKYPLEEICEKYLKNLEVVSRKGSNKFFTCTVAYMVALALWEGYKEVDFYGVELVVDSEYRFQRPGATFWVGLLCQHAKVRFFGAMLDAPLYGYEEEGAVKRELLEQRISLLAPQVETERAKIDPLQQAFAIALKRFKDTGVEYENAVTAWKALTAQLNVYGMVSGAMQELNMRIKEIDDMVALDGEYRFSHHGFERKAQALAQQREKTALDHAYQSGVIDFVFTNAVENRLQDSRRQKSIEAFEKTIPSYAHLCESIGIYAGAIAENKLLANVIQETEST